MQPSEDIKGFWSYVHSDNTAEGGRVIDLAHDIVAQYNMLTGDKVQLLFLDRDQIQWGDDWNRAINDNLAAVAFFIPIITPRYFLSAACRVELSTFASKAQSLGLKELILPILWAGMYLNYTKRIHKTKL